MGLVRLHRPKNLNALNAHLSQELLDALRSFDQNEAIGAMIVTGSERAFAAGADIAEMARKTTVQLRAENYFGAFDEIARLSKPIIAAVSGYALGGGCELALLCDIIIAADSAQFGQPEIKLRRALPAERQEDARRPHSAPMIADSGPTRSRRLGRGPPRATLLASAIGCFKEQAPWGGRVRRTTGRAPGHRRTLTK